MKSELRAAFLEFKKSYDYYQAVVTAPALKSMLRLEKRVIKLSKIKNKDYEKFYYLGYGLPIAIIQHPGMVSCLNCAGWQVVFRDVENLSSQRLAAQGRIK